MFILLMVFYCANPKSEVSLLLLSEQHVTTWTKGLLRTPCNYSMECKPNQCHIQNLLCPLSQLRDMIVSVWTISFIIFLPATYSGHMTGLYAFNFQLITSYLRSIMKISKRDREQWRKMSLGRTLYFFQYSKGIEILIWWAW